jgi:metal-responsive CopG/Arc/MetJ family transcriptional regulator
VGKVGVEKQVVCAAVPEEWKQELEELAKQEDTTVSAVLGELIDRGLHGQRPQQGGAAQPAEGQPERNYGIIMCGISMTPSLIQALTEAARSLGVSQNELVRRAIAAGLDYVKRFGKLPPCPYAYAHERKVTHGVYLAVSTLQEVDDALSKFGKSNRSYFIRRSICYYLTSVPKQGGGGGGA